MTNERELVARIIDGDEAAFRDLYREHSASLYAFIRRILGNRAEHADDVLQDAWLRVVRDLPKFGWRSSFRTWIFGVALNRCREVIRWSARRGVEEEVIEAGLEVVPRSGERVDVERALAKLSLRYREVLVLHDVYEYTHEEIGELLGIDPGTSKSNLSRGRQAMRSLIASPATGVK